MSSDFDVDAYPSADRSTDGDGGADRGVSPRSKKVIMYVALALPLVVLLVIAGVTRADNDKPDAKDKPAPTQPDDKGGSGEDAAPSTAWKPGITGRPASLGSFGLSAAEVRPGADPGLYLWSDFKGLHFWLVAGEGVPAEVTGIITSDEDLQPGLLAVENTGTVNTDGKAITFSLKTDEPVVGIDFNLGFFAKSVTFTVLDSDGRPVALPVKLGASGTAQPVPLEIRKG